MPRPRTSTWRTSSISATATSRCWRACTSRAARGRSRRWSSATAAPGARATASPRSCATRTWRRTASCRSRSISAPATRTRIRPRCRTSTTRCAGPSSTRAKLKTRPDLVGLSGQSSGGHLAMLVAMRPHDPRYAAIPLPAGSPALDASVRCVVMSWPVINPLSRYRHAKRAEASANPPDWPKSIIGAPGFLLAAAKPTWPRAIRCWRSSAARRC